jgi:pilus assembly protein Flp/PilA
MLNVVRQFVTEEEGASAAEYALILAIISLGIVTAVTGLGTAITTAVNDAAGKISGS